VCGARPTDPHHVYLKSRGGDDVFDNLVPLCRRCHGAYHEWNGPAVRRKIGSWLATDDGQECRSYLVGKLGRGAAESFMAREFGVRHGFVCVVDESGGMR